MLRATILRYSQDFDWSPPSDWQSVRQRCGMSEKLRSCESNLSPSWATIFRNPLNLINFGAARQLMIPLNREVTCIVERIFSNLLANALTHGDQNSPVWVVARSDDSSFEPGGLHDNP